MTNKKFLYEDVIKRISYLLETNKQPIMTIKFIDFINKKNCRGIRFPDKESILIDAKEDTFSLILKDISIFIHKLLIEHKNKGNDIDWRWRGHHIKDQFNYGLEVSFRNTNNKQRGIKRLARQVVGSSAFFRPSIPLLVRKDAFYNRLINRMITSNKSSINFAIDIILNKNLQADLNKIYPGCLDDINGKQMLDAIDNDLNNYLDNYKAKGIIRDFKFIGDMQTCPEKYGVYVMFNNSTNDLMKSISV